MTIIPKTQTDIDIQVIEDATNTFVNALNAAIFTLNICYKTLWDLPDDRLVAVLQRLYDINKLQDLFEDHYVSATSLNLIQEKAEYDGEHAVNIAAREFQVNDGIVTLVPLPQPDLDVTEIPIIEPLPE